MTTRTAAAAKQADGHVSVPAPASSVVVSPKLRRRPLLVVLAVALAAVGGVLGMLMWKSATSTVEVVIVRADVPRGEVIEAADLGVARVVTDPAMRTVPGADMGSLVGRRASVDLTAGTLLASTSITDVLQPAAGEAMVGVPIAPGLMPSEPLHAGDRVLLVHRPEASGGRPAGKPVVVAAVVVRVVPGNTQVVVDVLVPTGVATDLAATVLTGKVALVLDARVR